MEADDDDTEVVKQVEEMPDLRWEDKKFRNHTLNSLNKMRKERQFCDVFLRVRVMPVMSDFIRTKAFNR